MKKHYEDFRKVMFLFVCLILLIIVFIIFIFNSKISIYKLFNGVVYNEDTIVLVLSNEDVKLFQKNKVFYVENKKINFNILKIEDDVLEKGDKKYNQVFIKTNFSNMYKVNDVLDISIREKNVRSYEIFKIIWKGGYNEED